MQKGYLIGEKYRILDVLGKGGMSTVYLAENIKLGTLWAVKAISKVSHSRIDLLAEPNILKRLNHPALPRIFDIMENEHSIYIIVDYIEGYSLDKVLEEKGCIPEDKVMDWAKQLCRVLIYLHGVAPSPIIYRDMKPSNVILGKDGVIKLVDFGTAREYKGDCEGDTVYLGTRGYAAPEQFGMGQSNAATDIYSLGMTLFQLVTGKSPNTLSGEVETIRNFNSGVSKELEQIILRCIRFDPSERYQSVNELLSAIEKIEKSGIRYIDNKITASQPSVNESHVFTKVVQFRKLILSFIGNGEFVTGLAYLSSKLSNYKIALVDLDSLNPMCDYYLGVNRLMTSKTLGDRNCPESGVDLLLEGIRNNGSLSYDEIIRFSVKRKEADNLYIFTGKRQWEKYGKFSNEEVAGLIDLLYKNFDVTILMLNDSVKEPYTIVGANNCDYIVAAQRPYADEICASQRIMDYFCEEYNISLEKIKYVLYGTRSAGYDERFIRNEGFGLGDSLIGSIRHTDKYEKYRNRKALYVRCAEAEVMWDYKRILEFFHIAPKSTLSEVLIHKLRSISSTVRR